MSQRKWRETDYFLPIMGGIFDFIPEQERDDGGNMKALSPDQAAEVGNGLLKGVTEKEKAIRWLCFAAERCPGFKLKLFYSNDSGFFIRPDELGRSPELAVASLIVYQ